MGVAEEFWEVLRDEAAANDGTFTLEVRTGMRWDEAKFERLELAMRHACAAVEAEDALDRWLVEGFWCWCNWLPEWTGHPDFPRPEPPTTPRVSSG